VQRAFAALFLAVVGIAVPLTFEPNPLILVVLWSVVAMSLVGIIVTSVPVSNRMWGVVADRVAHRLPTSSQAETLAPATERPDRFNATAIRLEALAEEGEALHGNQVLPDAAWKHAFEDWDGRASALLVREAPRHLYVYRSWEEEPRPESGMDHVSQHRFLEWSLKNRISALKDIAIRLRAHAAEDLGPLTTKRALLKDLLLEAELVRQKLQAENAPVERVSAWDEKLVRLVRAALPSDDAERLLRFDDTTSFRHPDYDDKTYTLLANRERQFRAIQVQLGHFVPKDVFDPRDWTGLWR
jgi:hypothetical protein